MLDILELKGPLSRLMPCIVSETLQKISEKKAHVVVQVKKNQPKLYQAVRSLDVQIRSIPVRRRC